MQVETTSDANTQVEEECKFELNPIEALHETADSSQPNLTVSKICHIDKYRKFGVIEANNITYVDNSMDTLQQDHNLFTFYECNTIDLIYGDLNLPYVGTGMAYKDFIVIDSNPLKNWSATNIKKYPPLSSLTFVRNVANCLYNDNESYKKENSELKESVAGWEQRYDGLRRHFAVSANTLIFIHKIYIQICDVKCVIFMFILIAFCESDDGLAMGYDNKKNN